MPTKLEYKGSYADEATAETERSKIDGIIRTRKVDGKIRYFVFEKKEQK